MECLMRYASAAICGIALALLGGLIAGPRAAAASAAEPTVTCDRIVLRERSGTPDGFRIVLDTVSVPGPRHLAREASANPRVGWSHYRNAGLAIRSGASTVSVSVPEGWRDRVALSWGGSRPSSSIRFAPCAASARGIWNSYSGGFHLRDRADCVPLLVTSGGLSTTVRVGVGRACGIPH
jgi:hypothetical protein